MTYIELNAEFEAEYGKPGGYTACCYCGAAEVCCGSGSGSEDSHCPQCHQRDRAENGWDCRDDDDYADVPPECDGDTEDPAFSPVARQALYV